jgi:hypothetical protein
MTETKQGASMNSPQVGETRLAIVGATGMVGGYALRYALENPTVGRVTAIGRKKVGISHPKLKEVLHQDFADCSALVETLSGQDAAIFCLGAYTGAVSDAELRTITVDYTIEFARVLRGSSPDAAFSFLSGSGADPTGRSRVPFARYKGEAEKALLAAGFPHGILVLGSSGHHGLALVRTGLTTSNYDPPVEARPRPWFRLSPPTRAAPAHASRPVTVPLLVTPPEPRRRRDRYPFRFRFCIAARRSMPHFLDG